MKQDYIKVTIYCTNEFFGNIVRYDGKLINHGVRKYAQYENAPFVEFIPKGKRKIVRIQKSYKPYLLIINGYDNQLPDSMYGKSETKNGVTIKKSRYQSYDNRYKTDFDKILENSNINIIADYRYKG